MVESTLAELAQRLLVLQLDFDARHLTTFFGNYEKQSLTEVTDKPGLGKLTFPVVAHFRTTQCHDIACPVAKPVQRYPAQHKALRLAL
ncbi:MAG: hypothetical protein ACKPKO_44445, partial [Candidatus Fonsibacter sp.]